MKFSAGDRIEWKRQAGLGGWQPGTVLSVEQRTYTVLDSRGGRFANIRESYVRMASPKAEPRKVPPRPIFRADGSLGGMLDGHAAAEIDKLLDKVHARTVSGRDKAAVMAAPIVSRPKSRKPTRSRSYMAFVRERPCCICLRQADEAHHFGPRGMGTKATDLSCVPLCKEHHVEFHTSGRCTLLGLEMGRTETERHFYKAQAECLIEWIESKGEE